MWILFFLTPSVYSLSSRSSPLQLFSHSLVGVVTSSSWIPSTSELMFHPFILFPFTFRVSKLSGKLSSVSSENEISLFQFSNCDLWSHRWTVDGKLAVALSNGLSILDSSMRRISDFPKYRCVFSLCPRSRHPNQVFVGTRSGHLGICGTCTSSRRAGTER